MNALKMTLITVMMIGVGAFVLLSGCDRDAGPAMDSHDHHDAHHHSDDAEHIEQTTCPVMGIAINKDISTEYQGKTVYFCCPPCVSTFEANPEQYVDNLPQFN